MPLALDYYKIFTGFDEITLKFLVNSQLVEYRQHFGDYGSVRMFSVQGLALPVDKVTKNSITFSNYIFNRLVKFTIKYTDIKLLP